MPAAKLAWVLFGWSLSTCESAAFFASIVGLLPFRLISALLGIVDSSLVGVASTGCTESWLFPLVPSAGQTAESLNCVCSQPFCIHSWRLRSVPVEHRFTDGHHEHWNETNNSMTLTLRMSKSMLRYWNGKKYNYKFIITLNATIFASKQLAQSLYSRHVGSAFSMIIVSFWISCPLKLTRWYS